MDAEIGNFYCDIKPVEMCYCALKNECRSHYLIKPDLIDQKRASNLFNRWQMLNVQMTDIGAYTTQLILDFG